MEKTSFYEPGTFTSRRPAPTNFLHLRKWVEPKAQSIKLSSLEEIWNVTQQLEQHGSFYVSNVIGRVIAQLLGKYGDGFVTLEATKGGALNVHLVSSDVGAITNLRKAISFAGAASHEIIAAVAGKKIKITNLMFTVAGEVNITLQSAATALSGALDFGAVSEPRGMVHALGSFPLETAAGEAFNILASTGVQVSGYVTYYTE